MKKTFLKILLPIVCGVVSFQYQVQAQAQVQVLSQAQIQPQSQAQAQSQVQAQAQAKAQFQPQLQSHPQFYQYFEPQTVCVRYLHTGNYYEESFQVKGDESQGAWAKSLVNLIDKFEYGYQKVELYDLASGELLYSYSYNTLFSEYRTTEAGRNHNVAKTFREYVLVPLPKEAVRMVFYSRDLQMQYAVRYEIVFDPSKQKV